MVMSKWKGVCVGGGGGGVGQHKTKIQERVLEKSTSDADSL